MPSAPTVVLCCVIIFLFWNSLLAELLLHYKINSFAKRVWWTLFLQMMSQMGSAGGQVKMHFIFDLVLFCAFFLKFNLHSSEHGGTPAWSFSFKWQGVFLLWFNFIIVGDTATLWYSMPDSGSAGPSSSFGQGTVLCSLARHLTLIESIFTHVGTGKWIPVNASQECNAGGSPGMD